MQRKITKLRLAKFAFQTTKEQCPSWPTGREVMTTSSCWVRGDNSTPSPTVQSTPVNRTVVGDGVLLLPLTQQEEVVMTSRPVGQEGHCSLVVCSSPWPRKEFDWNGDVATRVDMRTTKVKFFKKYLFEGMSDPDKIIRPGR